MTARTADDEAREFQINESAKQLLIVIESKPSDRNAPIAARAVRCAVDLLTGKRTAPPPQFAPLMKFYGVSTLEGLVEAQERHVERLQEDNAKLRPPQSIFTRVRAG